MHPILVPPFDPECDLHLELFPCRIAVVTVRLVVVVEHEEAYGVVRTGPIQDQPDIGRRGVRDAEPGAGHGNLDLDPGPGQRCPTEEDPSQPPRCDLAITR